MRSPCDARIAASYVTVCYLETTFLPIFIVKSCNSNAAKLATKGRHETNNPLQVESAVAVLPYRLEARFRLLVHTLKWSKCCVCAKGLTKLFVFPESMLSLTTPSSISQ